ncbi:MAG: hypothetical protein ACOX6P_06980 [Candidatus Merdivicinus sp.]|jgi:hypothetical protein
MAHEILSVKLCQLDERLEKLHTRIHMSETANHDRLQQEITALEQECTEIDEILKKNLCHSKAPLTSVLSQNYGLIEQTIQKTDVQLHAMDPACQDGEDLVEKKILLAEYALDFAQRAADRALLLSLKAIDAQLVWQQKEGKDL